MATAVKVLQCGHFARRRDMPRGYLEGLCVEIDLRGHVHADALVEPRRAGRALRVDTEGDPVCAAGVERTEGLAEQRLAETAAAVLAPGAENVDPAEAEVVDHAKRGRGELVARTDEEAEVVDDLAGREPLVIGARVVIPVILEGGLEHLVQVALL